MPPIIPNRYYYPRCDNLNEPSRSYCRGYIDQCVAQRRTKGEGSSNFELVSDHGKRSTGLKFAECLQLAPTYAGHGKAKGAESQPSSKPLPSQDARPAGQDVMPGQVKAASDQIPIQNGSKVVLHRCNSSHFQPAGAKPPAWVGADAPEYALFCCTPKDFNDYPNMSSLIYDGAITIAASQTMLKYCDSSVQTSKIEGKDYTGTKIESKIAGVRSGPLPSAEFYLEERGDLTCAHAFYNWTSFTCPDGREYVCE